MPYEIYTSTVPKFFTSFTPTLVLKNYSFKLITRDVVHTITPYAHCLISDHVIDILIQSGSNFDALVLDIIG